MTPATIRLTVIAALAAAMISSCAKSEVRDSPRIHLEFTAGCSTRSTVSASDILWEAGDELSVFDRVSNNRFTTSAGGALAVFSGEASVSDTYCALYPYNAAAALDGEVIVTSLPAVQTARAGDFGRGSNVSVGKTSGNSLQMMNLCGYLKVGISVADRYTRVKFFSNSGAALSGDVRISFDSDGKPAASAGSCPLSSVTLSAESGTLAAGMFYVPVLPGTFTGGLHWILEDTDGNLYKGGNAYAEKVDRCRPLYLGSIDANVSPVSRSIAVDEELSELNPDAGRSSALIVLDTWSEDVSAIVKSTTMTDVSILKTAYDKFLVSFSNPSEAPQDFREVVLSFSAGGCSPVEATIRQNGLLKIDFSGALAFSPGIPEARTSTVTTNTFAAGGYSYTVSQKVCYRKSTATYLLFSHYNQDDGDYAFFQFPAISGRTLKKVYINFRGHNTNKKCSVEIQDPTGAQYSNYLKNNSITAAYTDSLVLGEKKAPESGVPYRLVGTANVNCLINSFGLVYE